jgi:hypothetical protein
MKKAMADPNFMLASVVLAQTIYTGSMLALKGQQNSYNSLKKATLFQKNKIQTVFNNFTFSLTYVHALRLCRLM